MAGSEAYCSKQMKPCIGWVHKVFKDCLCDFKDEVSFGFGLISLVSWGVAEVPQIITNFTNKSGHGVSLAFLLTWVAGDIFNLVGCLLEPATLPTQYYTALLYTISTVVLVLQSVYYDYVWKWWKNKKRKIGLQVEEDPKLPLNPKPDDPSMSNPSSPLKVSSKRKDVYYMSARSLASSGTPPYGSYLRAAKSGPSVLESINSSSDDEDDSYSTSSKKSPSKPITIPRSVGYGTFLVTSASIPFQSKALSDAYMRLAGRRLLMEHAETHSVYGVWLGWMMAAIYMGGRIPQIVLNIKRGSVEGLNPLMFIFALVANATYVGSILVRSTAWKKIKPNMPWLLDAIVCVVLDLFIILQYIYYRYMRRVQRSEKYYGDYVEAEKPI
ncbi:hypothetical protein ACHQM5_016994 [Ranunculus cassubicifolius]